MVADTNVVSEFMRSQPDAQVLRWAESIAPRDLAITVVTVEKIERGIGLLPRGARRRRLDQAWSGVLDSFAEAVLTYDIASAQATAAVLVQARRSGRPMSLADAQIAGICLAGGLRLATRNVDDFAAVDGLAVLNPFKPTD